MSDERVASRYAKSLLELSQEQGSLEKVYADMLSFTKVLSESRDLSLALRNPIIKHDKKLAILTAIFGGNMTELTMAFFRIITQKNREAVLESVAREFVTQYNLLTGIQKATVTTAVPLTPELRATFQQMVVERTGMKVELKEVVDPAVVGGYVLRIGDQQIDNTLRTSVQKLKNKFKENPYITKL
ncbi:ATP synthase F1 subunit delta [Rufibacter glacialis]|uniref:ATP synthase subunit delta n=1 Tax=Rufibacter glacialis TaxID=1259555 RepID=A0A5M8Q907_9BACT|nr:ATP synthase F1 subunit delta [Rufibacter glacialis]KAA6431062.1 ATP synthase F1 subunit delta [Rufibacter glacialis]GGK83707.1 ATP synthase subunit delta [Rufibacter glacialis]